MSKANQKSNKNLVKKQKGQRDNEPQHKIVKINKIIKLDYIVEMLCWCGNTVIIDSSKSVIENVCPSCGSPHKLLGDEWTNEEKNKFLQLKGLK